MDKKYSISDLEQLSGVSAHNIRIWERRYNALQPARSAGNTRFYDDNQLRRLLNIVSLSESGVKISKACALTEEEMNELVGNKANAAAPADESFEYYVSRLLKYGLEYDERNFDFLLSKCIADHGIGHTYKNVIYPLLVRLGWMWGGNNICPAQEHFISNIIRQKLITAINGIPVTSNEGSSWILFMPEDEDHELGLLFACFIIRSAGHKVIYLGTKVPLESLIHGIDNNTVQNLLLFMVRSRPLTEAAGYINELQKLYPDKSIHLAGNARLIAGMSVDKSIRILNSIEEFELVVDNEAAHGEA